ncbi:hypothetical protein LTR36_005546 [Oleoguttula mirabilis]|uniref:Pali-domain-containing protein n=1 Tax=Oleoguttula mirabilis TaxID=1507867 RepID=A0AAV9JFW7_9PEZI|nr:hypothetical protein LTR36_005546 [Oleoguttula mirabilis]
MGLLRPATPLSIIFFVAFVLLLLSTLSTPIIRAIPLGAFQGYNFGVFGYCKGTACSGFKIGYSTDGLFSGDANDDFELPSSTRHSLSAILIVHPVAAFLTLVCFCLAFAAHFHSPSHSPRYLLALLILTIPTLLVTLLAFLVDILLFVPHVQWGGWIVLAATILIIASSVVTCAMRRTLVSRKARKKRIEENADMSGANYYENLHQNRLMADELPKADSPPPMGGSTAGDKAAPQFAAYEMQRPETRSQDSTANGGAMMDGGRRSTDDSTPLNPARDPSVRSASTGGAGRRPYGPPGSEEMPPMPMGRPSMDSNGGMGGPRRPSRDQYGNLIGPAAAMGAMGVAAGHDLPPPGLRHEDSQGSLGSNRSNGGVPRGGRGSYGPPGRGYGQPRGGYGPPRGGSYGPRDGGYRGQAPPPGWRGGRGGYGGPPPQGMMGGGRGGMPRQGPPPGYAASGPVVDPYYTNPRSAPSPTMGMPPSDRPVQAAMQHHDEFVAGPAGQIGQAIEMDERTGSPPGHTSPTGHPQGFPMSVGEHEGHMSPNYGLRDSDGDVAGMVGLQQGRPEDPSMARMDSDRSGVLSLTSNYSDQAYVPPRAQWAPQQQQQQRHLGADAVSPMDSASSGPQSSNAMPSSNALPYSPVQASPTLPRQAHHAPKHVRNGSEAYYEDVDPRFAIDPASEVGSSHDQPGPLPSALTPGAGGYAGYNPQARMHSPNHLHPPSSRNIPSYVSGSASGGSTDNDHSTPASLLGEQQQQRTTRGQGLGGSGDGPADHSSYENLPEGARSPGEGSEASHFTSVSQRGINPNWRPGPGSAYAGSAMGAPSSASAVQRRREDVILNANPDFSLPGMGPSGRNAGGGRGRGGRGGPGMGMGAMRGVQRSPTNPTAMGLTPSGRYPNPTDI